MNYMMIMGIMGLMTQAMNDLADGKLTSDEMVGLVSALLKIVGIKVEGVNDLFGFETREGNVYIRIGKDLLDKLALKVNIK